MNSKTAKELRRISEGIPQELLDRLTVKRYENPTIRKVVKKALEDPEVDDELKRKLQNIKDTGQLDKKVDTVNRTAEKEIEKWVEDEVAKAIKLKRIPDPKNDKDLQAYLKKTKKHGKKNKKGDN